MWTSVIFLSLIIHCTVSIEITPIPAPLAGIGFAPVWDDCTQSLYYVDYIGSGQNFSIFRYGYNEDRAYGAYITGITSSPSFILPVKDCNKFKNLFAVGINHDTVIIEWDGKSPAAQVSTLFSVEEFDQNSRWCLAKQSKHGHFYGGTNHITFCNSPKNASLYMYSPNRGVTRLFGGVISTTGLAFDNDHLYHVDACTNLMTAFDATSCGDICNGRIIFDFNSLGMPDFVTVGLDIDTDGFLYTGNYAGKQIWKIDQRTSSGIPIAEMPFKGIGGLAFGGRNRDILFVTTVHSYVQVLLAQITETIDVPSSLYKITGLGAAAHGSSNLIV